MEDAQDDFEELFGKDSEAVRLEWKQFQTSQYHVSLPPLPAAELQLDLLEPPTKRSRFVEPKSSPEREKAARGVVPKNTESSTRWAVQNFESWASNRVLLGHPVPDGLLHSHDAGIVCKYLCLYVLETRKEDGTQYPPSTLRVLVSGLNRVLQQNKAPFSVLDKSNPNFRDLLKTLDSVSSNLHRDGIGVYKDSANVITADHEQLFWDRGLLGMTSPKQLQETAFFYMGLNFVLRGIQEQYNLVPSQLQRVPPDYYTYDSSVYYEYTEFISKNNQHRFKDINSSNKQVRSYAQPESNRCLVKMLDMYLSYLPSNAKIFDLRPLAKFPETSEKSCFSKQRVGENTLAKIIPNISKNSGCGVHYTNHSLRATAITRMFNSGLSEKVICETSGHRSMKALRCYEHTSNELQKQVTAVVNLDSNKENKKPLNDTCIKEDTKEDIKVDKPKPTVPGFNGTFQNCTFNIH